MNKQTLPVLRQPRYAEDILIVTDLDLVLGFQPTRPIQKFERGKLI